MDETPPPPQPDAAGESFFRRPRASTPRAAAAAAPAAAVLGPGSRIAHFVLREFIASGGMGQVWLAEDTELRRPVALKLVRPELVDARALSFFAREARAGGRLNHPNIVTTLASGTDAGVAWIAQELIEGSWTLKDFIESVRAEDAVPRGYYRNVAELVAQVADALDAAHAAGVIHRDVKPANILITSDDRPKLTDFGLARVADESVLSVTGDLAGSWAYMSPEQIAARRAEVDHRTDVFSLGVVLYELLALRRPFDGDTTHQIAEQIARFDPPDPSKVRSRCPRELAVICAKALEKSKAARYASAAELAADLRAHLADEPIVAQAPGPLARLVKWSRRHPTRAAVAGVGAVAFAVVSGLLAVNARLAAVAAAERDDVLRLAAAQDLDDLLAEQAALWPPHPDRRDALAGWLTRASELVAELPLHRAKRDELLALALAPGSAGDLEAGDVEAGDPGAGSAVLAERRRALEAELAVRRAALAVRRGEAPPAPPAGPLDLSGLPADPDEWNAVVWPLVNPRRTVFGQEARGVAIAEAALDRAREELRPGLLESVAWGHFALGRDADALAAAAAAEAAALEGLPALRSQYARVGEMLEAGAERAVSDEGLAFQEAQVAALEAELAELRTRPDDPRFPPEHEAARWWVASLTSLIERLEALDRDLIAADATTPEHGWSVGRRLALAERLAAGSAPGGELDRAWREHLPAIRAAHPQLDLEPQVGLLPLGPDPDSGYFEFAHLASGEAPERDAAGRLVLTEETGVVLVLVPGGEFWMGAQSTDPTGRHHDPAAYPDEGPVHRVALSPYFISKYELTQAQWLRATGTNPSYHQPPSRLAPSLLHPVEQVSWDAAVEALARLGLELPTEAQWEHAARAGTDTPWTFGAEREALRGRLNIADGTAADDGAGWDDIAEWPDHEDGGVIHTEVGRYPANGFGLHEVHGNVWEWCRDEFDVSFYTRSPRTDPRAPELGQNVRVRRGGGFSDAASFARVSLRTFGAPEEIDYGLGLRPARPVERSSP